MAVRELLLVRSLKPPSFSHLGRTQPCAGDYAAGKRGGEERIHAVTEGALVPRGMSVTLRR